MCRDILRGEAPNDWDFATTATPTEMKDIFNKEGIPVTDTFGERYGKLVKLIAIRFHLYFNRMN